MNRYLNRILLISFPLCGNETNVINTPGSTCATHSFGSSSSMKTIDSLLPLTEAGVPEPHERFFSLASISFPQSRGVEFELPALLYEP